MALVDADLQFLLQFKYGQYKEKHMSQKTNYCDLHISLKLNSLQVNLHKYHKKVHAKIASVYSVIKELWVF